jgi:hypothetical protein
MPRRDQIEAHLDGLWNEAIGKRASFSAVETHEDSQNSSRPEAQKLSSSDGFGPIILEREDSAW